MFRLNLLRILPITGITAIVACDWGITLLRSDIILCFHKINNKENMRLISGSRILDLHKILDSVD